MRVAPASTAPCTTLSPTPPHPKMATDDPFSTLARLTTEPTPVMTAHPMMDAFSSGVSSRTLTSWSAGTTLCSEKVPTMW